MTKTKKTNPQTPLVIAGYILFVLLIIAVLLSTTIPFGRMLFNPRVLHHNVALFTVALTVGTILPTYLGYAIGDHSVKSKSKRSHHFNGVLFGLLAYWIMSILSVFTYVSIPAEYFTAAPNVRVVVVNLLPSIGIAIITALLAIAHIRSRQAKRDILEYKPYIILLIGSVILLPSESLIIGLFSLNVSMYSFISLAMVVSLGLISYATLWNSKLSRLAKLTWSAISVSVAFVWVFVSSQLVSGLSYYITVTPTMEFQTMTSALVWALALIGWVIYWSIQVKALSGKPYSP